MKQPAIFLNKRQKSILVGTILTDGTIELANNGKSARVRLEISDKTVNLVNKWTELLLPLTTANVSVVNRGKVRQDGTCILTVRSDTFFHPSLLEFYKMFHNLSKNSLEKPKKTVPLYNDLMEFLDWEMFAYMLMFDGSKKGQGRSMELHLQSFTYEAQARLCVAIYDKLGIKCWPAKYGKNKAQTVMQYHTIISGFSLDLIYEKVKPHFLPEFEYKIPVRTSKVMATSRQAPWEKFYNENKSAVFLNTFLLDE